MKWEDVKGFVLGGGALVVGGMLLAYMEWRVDVTVNQALSALDIGTDAKIVSMDRDIASNRSLANRNKEEIDDAERRVEQAFQILLGRDPNAVD